MNNFSVLVKMDGIRYFCVVIYKPIKYANQELKIASDSSFKSL